MTKSKVTVVTGGAGFLGSHICDRLLERGHKVICMDNLLTGDKANIAHLSKDRNFEFIRQDVSKSCRVPGRVDYVMHCASPASPVEYLGKPIETMLVGSHGTYNTLELAKAKKAVYLVTSTSEIYGDPLEHPQREQYWGHVNPIGPRSVYDEAKRYAEAMTFAYRRLYKVDTKVVRIFNTYGPRMQMNDGRVVPNFICQALQGLPLTIYGDGKQTRSFCYVDDEADGILRLLFSELSGPVNIGNPVEFNMLDFAQIVLELVGGKSRLVFQ
ncbi:MAG: NAD-dependent epimerase/dehydratase family protein, partial [Candidatus Omnitrophica bacterium]|nr:NAD-dependent epimerase/dehydratase family protein [Candidatus Omnitrophota bacterium]